MKKNCKKKYEELGAEPSEEYFFLQSGWSRILLIPTTDTTSKSLIDKIFCLWWARQLSLLRLLTVVTNKFFKIIYFLKIISSSRHAADFMTSGRYWADVIVNTGMRPPWQSAQQWLCHWFFQLW